MKNYGQMCHIGLMTAPDAYALIAPFYDRFHDHTRILALRQIVMQETSPCSTLDVGAGTGLMGRYLAHHGYQVSLLDASRAMLDKACEHASKEGLSLTYLHQSMLDPYPKHYKLIVASMDVVNHLPNLEAVEMFFQRVYDALEEDGLFIFDSLTCHYIQQFIGYQETLPVKPYPLSWHVHQGLHACSLEHHFSDGTHQHVIYERSYSVAMLKTKLTRFKHITHHTLEDRHVFIVSR